MPFAYFIKQYFSTHKKFGSKDRREVSNLCYSFFRIGNVATDLPVDERILAGKILCTSKPDEFLEELKHEWNNKVHLPVKEKLLMFSAGWKDVFQWQNELCDGIEFEKFSESFFVQPDLFLRIRPGFAERVLLKLNDAAVDYEFISPFTIRLPNSFTIDKYFVQDKEVVVQDYNSQRVGEIFLPVRRGQAEKLWDCCAGSGGKSIMAYDLNPVINLFVSDVRESILSNLKKRFDRAGIKKYHSLKLDLGQSPLTTRYALSKAEGSQFNLIIADVPCTGSGTWSRTPEQLFYFNEKKIKEYSLLQRNIITNVIPHLQPGGHLLYITCSVFKKENEEVVEYIKKQNHLHLVKMVLLKGYEMKADTMFAALLQKTL